MVACDGSRMSLEIVLPAETELRETQKLAKESYMGVQAIKMLSSMAARDVLSVLAARHEQASGQTVALESVGGVDAARRVEGGEAVDVVVLAGPAIDKLIVGGMLQADSRVEIARSGIGIAVRASAVHPDIHSGDAVKAAVLAASTLGYSTGPSGTYLTSLFERWGIAAQIAPRIVQAPPGVPVASLLARGEVELGFQQLSELIHAPGIDVLGALPDDIQSITVFCGAVSSASECSVQAQALLRFLASPATAATKLEHGMEPA